MPGSRRCIIRHYERIGLLMPRARDSRGVRGYDREAIIRLQLIRDARNLGLATNEIRAPLASDGGRAGLWLDTRVQELQALRHRILAAASHPLRPAAPHVPMLPEATSLAAAAVLRG